MSSSNLYDLKSRIRRNPHAYKNDVLRQINHWESMLSLLKMSSKPTSARARTKDLQELINFLSSVVDKYPSEQRCMKLFPCDLFTLLSEHSETLNILIKKCIIRNLVLLHNKSLISTTKLLSLFFKLLSLNSKILRFLIYSSIIKIITHIHRSKNGQNEIINRSLQNYLFNLLRDESEMTVRKSLSIIVELYRRNIWKNSKTVNIIAEISLYHKSSQIVRQSLHFLLGHKITIFNEFKEEELKEMENRRLKSQIKTLKFNTRKRRKKTLAIAKLEEEKEEKMGELLEGINNNKIDLSAIRSLYDPQTFIEKLFKRLNKNKFLWDIRLLIINLISRLISTHQLILFPFYSYIIKYLKQSQKNITNIIAFTAQSIHKLIPPEIVSPLIIHISNEFINQFSCKESIAVGINGIRLICKRQPYAINIDLLHDLTEYVKYKRDKGVQMAARALIHLYRIQNPQFLRVKNRGKYHRKDENILQFGEERIIKNIPGAELFEKEEELLNNKVYITKNEAMFLEICDDIEMVDELDNIEYCIVENEKMRNEKNNENKKPLLIRRILTNEDLERLKELRVNNLMKLWNRKREEVGLIEEMESDDEIDINQQVQSQTIIQKQKKEERKEAMKKTNNTKNQKTWDDYRKDRGGGTTNKEKNRNKPFKMTKYAMRVMRKGKRSLKLQKMITSGHKKRLKMEGNRVKRRRR